MMTASHLKPRCPFREAAAKSTLARLSCQAFRESFPGETPEGVAVGLALPACGRPQLGRGR